MARTGVRVSAIIVRDGKVLLIHRKKPGKEYWVFPGGGVEDDETLEETLVREVKEETNLDVLNYKKAFVAPFSQLGKIEHPFFYCEVSSGEPEIVGEEKYINSPEDYYHLEWITISNIKSLNLIPPEANNLLTSFLSDLNLFK